MAIHSKKLSHFNTWCFDKPGNSQLARIRCLPFDGTCARHPGTASSSGSYVDHTQFSSLILSFDLWCAGSPTIQQWPGRVVDFHELRESGNELCGSRILSKVNNKSDLHIPVDRNYPWRRFIKSSGILDSVQHGSLSLAPAACSQTFRASSLPQCPTPSPQASQPTA